MAIDAPHIRDLFGVGVFLSILSIILTILTGIELSGIFTDALPSARVEWPANDTIVSWCEARGFTICCDGQYGECVRQFKACNNQTNDTCWLRGGI